MKMIIEYNGEIELKYNGISNDMCSKIIDWWTTGKINDEISDSVGVFGIDLNRYYIKSIKFEREKKNK